MPCFGGAFLFLFVLPHYTYVFCFIGKVGTFTISFPAKTSRRRTELLAVLIIKGVVLVAAMRGNQENFFTVILVLVHFLWCVRRCILAAIINYLLNTGWNGSIGVCFIRFIFLPAFTYR